MRILNILKVLVNNKKLNNNMVSPYVFVGLTLIGKMESGKLKIIDNKEDRRISIKVLNNFIKENFSNILIKSKKAKSISEKFIVTYTLNKYIHCFKSTNAEIARKVLNIDHSTRIYRVKQFEVMKGLNKKCGLYEEEINKQKDIDALFIKFIMDSSDKTISNENIFNHL